MDEGVSGRRVRRLEFHGQGSATSNYESTHRRTQTQREDMGVFA